MAGPSIRTCGERVVPLRSAPRKPDRLPPLHSRAPQSGPRVFYNESAKPDCVYGKQLGRPMVGYASKPDVMSTIKSEFLGWKTPPARLNATQAAWFLGFDRHEIPILLAAGCLKPLGHPARNAPKFFATETLSRLRQDERWLAKASDAISSHWRRQNARKRSARGFGNGSRGALTRADRWNGSRSADRGPSPSESREPGARGNASHTPPAKAV